MDYIGELLGHGHTHTHTTTTATGFPGLLCNHYANRIRRSKREFAVFASFTAFTLSAFTHIPIRITPYTPLNGLLPRLHYGALCDTFWH